MLWGEFQHRFELDNHVFADQQVCLKFANHLIPEVYFDWDL